MKKITALALCLLIQTSSYAATEYLRFEGSISSNYPASYNEQYGLDFEPSQVLYFDIEIDTEIDPADFTDPDHANFFQTTLIGGTLGVGELEFSFSGRTVEDFVTAFDLVPGLQLSRTISCDGNSPPEVCDIDDGIPAFHWPIGSSFWLSPGPYANDTFGYTTLTYRSSEPPPPIPLPGAVWLMLGALTGLGWLGKQSKITRSV